jgi:hypothetical protein
MNFRKAMLVGAVLASALCREARAEDSTWVSLLQDGLNGWTGYFNKLGVGGAKDTWKITPEGWLHVDIQVDFKTSGYGHLFYTKRKLSYYMVRAEYRFPKPNTYGPNWGQGWNMENNGLMLHSEDPATMNGKEFPNSLEVQLLGKNNQQNPEMKSSGFKYATSANLCTPGTYVSFKGNDNYTQHCTHADYPAAWKNTDIPFEAPDDWSDVTARVLADSLVEHYIHGIKVMEYSKIRLENSQTPVKDGYLSIQAEGTSTQFRKIEVLDLVGCMDKSKSAYRSYFVKNDPAACAITGVTAPGGALAGARLFLRGGRLAAERLPAGPATFEILSPDGRVLAVAEGPEAFALPAGLPRFFLARARTASGILTAKLVRP